MSDFGPQAAYIYASYAVSAVILGGMIGAALIKRAAARRRLAALDGSQART